MRGWCISKCLVSCILLVILDQCATNGSLIRRRDLLIDLFENYSIDARPSKSVNEPVNLTFGFSISEIIEMEEKRQTFGISLRVKQVWTNHFLTWDPKQYSGVSHVILPPKRVWLPDIVLYNNVHKDNTNSEIGLSSKSLVLYHNGTIVWIFPIIVKTKCEVDITYFPFDEQACDLKFGSWTFDSEKLHLTAEKDYADTREYMPNSVWALVSVPASSGSDSYKCCPKYSYMYITYHVNMRRRSLYFLINLILPIMLVVTLSIITFIIPIKCGERMKVAFALLLSMFEFMRVIEDIIPSSSDVVPLISYLFGIILLEMVIVVVVNCLIFQISFPPYRSMPNWLKGFLRRIYKARLVNTPQNCLVNGQQHISTKVVTTSGDDASLKERLISECSTKFHDREVVFQNKYAGGRENLIPCQSKDCRCYGRSYSCLKRRSNRVEDKSMSTTVEERSLKDNSNIWNTLAFIINKFFSWFLGSIIFGTTLAVFLCAWPRYTS